MGPAQLYLQAKHDGKYSEAYKILENNPLIVRELGDEIVTDVIDFHNLRMPHAAKNLTRLISLYGTENMKELAETQKILVGIRGSESPLPEGI